MMHGLAKQKKKKQTNKQTKCTLLVSFPWNKWAGSEGDHSPTSDAEVKNEWNYT